MKRIAVLGLGLTGIAATPTSADERYFGYTYAAEPMPKGANEIELWATDRRGKEMGHYDAQDYRIELEHGFTDRLTISAYLNLESHHISGLAPDFDDVHRNFAVQGLSSEIKYNLLSPYKDGFGLTLYAEPAWSRILSVEGQKGTEYELELKAIFQKDFLDDRLIWATNLVLEPELEHEKANEGTGEARRVWNKELQFHLTSGVSYRIAPGWFAGLEGRYSSIYPDFTRGLHRETYAVFAGPTIHYAAQKWWVTATYQPQLFGSPNPRGGLALDEYEKREIRVIFGYEFG
jgi:Family of unknown function (DUF6662)